MRLQLPSLSVVLALLLGFAPATRSADKPAPSPTDPLRSQARAAMLRATRFMVEKVSTRGGYVWQYLPDRSRRWGELEAYDTMIWLQPPGTPSMGQLFLDAYGATHDEYYYQAAEKVGQALVAGQLECGGWNYLVDFAGEPSLQRWYATVGKNAWRLEEFQHYYGNATFDDNVTSDTAGFLLRLYLTKRDTAFKPALDRAIAFVLASQYPNGGWPQRFPLRYDFSKPGHPDYTSLITFNDDVIAENVRFLIACYKAFGDQRLLDPIHRGMDVYLLTQQAPPQAGWAQQYTVDLKPAGARTYEPTALLPQFAAQHVELLMEFYRLTGDSRYMARIPEALDWLESTKLPGAQTENGRFTHPKFVEIGTNRPLFVHRRGSNVVNGAYYVDYEDGRTLGHYGPKRTLDVARLRPAYEALRAQRVEDVTRNSPLLPGHAANGGRRESKLAVRRTGADDQDGETGVPTDSEVRQVLAALDSEGRWLTTQAMTSHPYGGDGRPEGGDDQHYLSTYVGDESDTSPYPDTSGQAYISTFAYIRNMHVLMRCAAAPGN